MTNKNKSGIIALTFFVSIFLFIYFSHAKKNEILRDNGVVVEGKVISCYYLSRGGGLTNVKYGIVVNGKTIKGVSAYTEFSVGECNENINGRTVKVIVDTIHKPIDNSHLLLTPDDFKTFGLEFPDSLKWVKLLKP